MTDRQPIPHVTYCLRDNEITTLSLDMKVVKGQLAALVQSQTLVEHALLGTLSDMERKGLLEEHHEHRVTLFGDKKKKGDGGLVQNVAELREDFQRTKWMGRGAAAAFGMIGSAIALLGIKGMAAVFALLTSKGVGK